METLWTFQTNGPNSSMVQTGSALPIFVRGQFVSFNRSTVDLLLQKKLISICSSGVQVTFPNAPKTLNNGIKENIS